MIRNPHRPWWLHLWLTTPFDEFMRGIESRKKANYRPTAKRILWAARHACKRLRTELIQADRQLVEAQQERDRLTSKLESLERVNINIAANQEKLVAFQWLVKWLSYNYEKSIPRIMGGIGWRRFGVIDGQLEVNDLDRGICIRHNTVIEICNALDPNWREQ